MRHTRHPFRFLAGPRDHTLLAGIVILATTTSVAASHLIDPNRSSLPALAVAAPALAVGTGRRTAWWMTLAVAVIDATFAAATADLPTGWRTVCLFASIGTSALLLCAPFNPLLQRHRTLDDRRFESRRLSNERIRVR